jgi:hypothetical protein
MRTIVMENSLIRIVSLLDKGSDVIELLYKPLDLNLMWHSPTGWRNPLKEASANPVTHGGFLDYYGGGWQDIAPSAGGHSVVYRGAERLPLLETPPSKHRRSACQGTNPASHWVAPAPDLPQHPYL